MADGERKESVWPEWQVIRQIGKGSYGKVYGAVRNDYQVESKAAIKVISIPQDETELDSLRSEGLNPDATRTYLREVVNDFVKEIQMMETLKGVQNIVSVEDYRVVEKTDAVGWDIYIRMELLTPLYTYLAGKEIDEAEVVQLGCDICTALEICAKRNIIHRDIKPENIFVNDFGYFKLGDFGIARKLEHMTAGLSQKGTASYMAPEVEKGMSYDATVDLYSLGLVLYRLMNKNRLPFLDTKKQILSPNDRMMSIRRRLDGEPLPPPCDASPLMASAILCACAPDPKKRFATAAAMKNALQSVMEDEVKQQSEPKPVQQNMSDQRDATDGEWDEGFTEEEAWTRRKRKKQEKKSQTQQGKKKKPVGLIVVCILAVAAAAAGFGVYQLHTMQVSRYNSLVKEQIASREDSEAEAALYEEAVSLMPSGLESYYQHAAALYEYAQSAGDADYQDCITFIENEILQNDALDLTQERMADVYGLYVACYLAQEDYTDAVTAYESLFKIGTEDVVYYRDYAVALACCGNTAKAEKFL
ncbi:MAG: serine/threonine protein kinase [Clostridiales bacterium]|nr:serine/threonine protein kinase [Clostridiales bacterium]